MRWQHAPRGPHHPTPTATSQIGYVRRRFGQRLRNGTASHGNPVTFVVWRQPEHGEVSQSLTGELSTPRPNFNGSDRFTTSRSRRDCSYDVPVSIEVLSMNDPIALATIPDDEFGRDFRDRLRCQWKTSTMTPTRSLSWKIPRSR
jgi:hypothetical protein